MRDIAHGIILHFYPEDTPLRQCLLRHSTQVREKALALLRNAPGSCDPEIVVNGAMLHDIGIRLCHAPEIFCTGDEPYIRHGLLGAELLRAYDPALEVYARICERHTGAGLTAENIRNQSLPLPVRDFLPETMEEKLICLADKFYSKSGDMEEKPLEKVRRSLARFGTDSLERFDGMYGLFSEKN